MPPPITSFYHAIYKRLWAVARSVNAHMDDGSEDGGFTLLSTNDPAGIFGTTLNNPPYPMQSPLNAADGGQAINDPLYAVLLKSFDPNPPVTIPVAGKNWTVMPPASSGPNPTWNGYNAAAPKLIDKVKEWIEQNGKYNDTPNGSHLEFADWSGGPSPPNPQAKNKQILLVCSTVGDNGVRPGSINQNNYWNSSQIFVCDSKTGHNLGLPVFKPTEVRTINAIIGNAGTLNAGKLSNLAAINVKCNAYVFNAGFSPGFALPELSALDAPSAGPDYEQPGLTPSSYAVVGFRFDVDQVFQGLHDAMKLAFPNPQPQLGVPTVDAWLKANKAHACVKVFIKANELPNMPPGDYPGEMVLPTNDRHVAQRNLAAFDMTEMAMKKIKWQYFIMNQAGAGANGLAIQQAWPKESARFFFALPPQMWARYGAKAVHRGFEVVRDAEPKPFPDAVILRQIAPGARLDLLDHAKERFFGMALGVEGDPARLKSVRGDLSVVHTGPDGHVGGGFTLRPEH